MENYKKVSELGLETIQLEDQVLLVDSKWKYKNNKLSIYSDMISIKSNATLSGWFGIGFVNNHKEIIASTKQLEGLPLLVIEDEVEKLAEAQFDDILLQRGFKTGYKTSQKSHPYSEEDMARAIEMARVFKFRRDENDYTTVEFQKAVKDIIQSLTKKELWVEVELSQIKSSDRTGYSVERVIPKIIEGKIKAVWK